MCVNCGGNLERNRGAEGAEAARNATSAGTRSTEGRGGGRGDLGDGMLACQLAAELAADFGDKLAEDARVWAGKVDVLKDALRRAELLGQAERGEGARLDRVLVDDDHLAGFDVAHVLGLAQVERARLRRNAVAIGAARAALRQLPDAQRPEAVWITDGDHGLVRHEDDREGLSTDPSGILVARLR